MSRIVYTDYYKSENHILLKQIIDETKLTESFGTQTREEYYETFREQSRLDCIAACEKQQVLPIFADLITKALKETGINADEIAYIMHTDYANVEIDNFVVSHYLAEQFSFKRAKITTVQEGCAGTLYSMGLAMSLLNEKNKYMLILSSSIVPEGTDRFLGYTTWSDGVGIMIVGCGEGENTLVDWNTHYNCLDYYADSNKMDIDRQNIVNKGIELMRETVNRNGITLKDLDMFVPQNVHHNGYVYQYGRMMGLPENKIFISNISKYGHSGDVDTLINTGDYIKQDREKKSGYSLLYGMGGNNGGRCYHCILIKDRQRTAQ